MSRIGKQPIEIPDKVKVTLGNHQISVEGPKGKLSLSIPKDVLAEVVDHKIVCKIKESGQETHKSRARYGLIRSLIANMVQGCFEGFKKELDVVGIGYRAAVKGRDLELSLGFSHIVTYPIPAGVNITVDKLSKLIIEGADRQLVGQTAAEIRVYRRPEPYKGKGIKYSNEVIRRKAGKSAASTTSS